jgi:HK97 family phage major capsid protein
MPTDGMTEDKKKMSIREITEAIGSLYESMKALVTSSQDNGEPMSSEQEEQYARMNSRLTDLIKMRDQHYALLDAAAHASRALDKNVEALSRDRKNGESKATKRGDNLREFLNTEEYRNAFNRYLRVGASDLRPDEQRALVEGTDSAGGYLPAPEFLTTLVQYRWENNVFRQISNIIPLGTFETEIVIEGGTFPTATYENEGATKTASDPNFANLVMTPRTLRCFTQVSNELLADAPSRGPQFNVETILARQFGRVMGLKEEQAFGNGNGSAPNPKGFFAYTGAGEIGAYTTASKTAITIADLQGVVAALKRQYRDGAVWVMTDEMFWKIRGLLMNSTVGATPSGIAYSPLAWSLGDGRLQDGEPDRLLGYPVKCCATGAAPAFAAGAVVAGFGNFANYFHIGEREGISIKVARETYLATNQTGYFAFARHTCAPSVYEAFKHLKMLA